MANIIKALAQTFKHYKLVDNHTLNKWGMQKFRMKTAHWFYEKRKKYYKPELEREYNAIHNEGYFAVENYLSKEDFAGLKTEVLQILADEGVKKIHKDYGNKQKTLVQFDILEREKYPILFKLQSDPYIRDLFQIGERRDIDLSAENCYIEKLTIGTGVGHDYETDLHSDVFHNSFKSWLYITDVEKKHAPFVFVPGSNKLLPKRLKYVYENSIKPKPDKSRRIFQDELDDFGFKEKEFTVKENTFLIANTFGYHKRNDGEAGNERIGILFAVRANPFSF